MPRKKKKEDTITITRSQYATLINQINELKTERQNLRKQLKTYTNNDDNSTSVCQIHTRDTPIENPLQFSNTETVTHFKSRNNKHRNLTKKPMKHNVNIDWSKVLNILTNNEIPSEVTNEIKRRKGTIISSISSINPCIRYKFPESSDVEEVIKFCSEIDCIKTVRSVKRDSDFVIKLKNVDNRKQARGILTDINDEVTFIIAVRDELILGFEEENIAREVVEYWKNADVNSTYIGRYTNTQREEQERRTSKVSQEEMKEAFKERIDISKITDITIRKGKNETWYCRVTLTDLKTVEQVMRYPIIEVETVEGKEIEFELRDWETLNNKTEKRSVINESGVTQESETAIWTEINRLKSLTMSSQKEIEKLQKSQNELKDQLTSFNDNFTHVKERLEKIDSVENMIRIMYENGNGNGNGNGKRKRNDELNHEEDLEETIPSRSRRRKN